MRRAPVVLQTTGRFRCRCPRLSESSACSVPPRARLLYGDVGSQSLMASDLALTEMFITYYSRRAADAPLNQNTNSYKAPSAYRHSAYAPYMLSIPCVLVSRLHKDAQRARRRSLSRPSLWLILLTCQCNTCGIVFFAMSSTSSRLMLKPVLKHTR